MYYYIIIIIIIILLSKAIFAFTLQLNLCMRFKKSLTEMEIYWENVLGRHKNNVTMQIILIILNNLVKRLW